MDPFVHPKGSVFYKTRAPELATPKVKGVKFQLILHGTSRVWPVHAVTRMFAQYTCSISEERGEASAVPTTLPQMTHCRLARAFFSPLLLDEDAASEESENTEDSQKTQVPLQLETSSQKHFARREKLPAATRE